MKLSDYVRYDGIGLAELLRGRQVSAAELLEAAFAAADAVDPQLGALVHQQRDAARALAKAPPPGPFSACRSC